MLIFWSYARSGSGMSAFDLYFNEKRGAWSAWSRMVRAMSILIMDVMTAYSFLFSVVFVAT